MSADAKSKSMRDDLEVFGIRLATSGGGSPFVAPSATLRDLKRMIRRANQRQVLRLLAQLSSGVSKTGGNSGSLEIRPNLIVTQWDLDYLARTVLRFGTASGQERWAPLDLLNAVMVVQNLPDAFDSADEKASEANSFLVRIAHTQFPHQRMDPRSIGRLFALLVDPGEKFWVDTQVDHCEEFRKLTGLSPRELLVTGFGAWASALGGKGATGGVDAELVLKSA